MFRNMMRLSLALMLAMILLVTTRPAEAGVGDSLGAYNFNSTTLARTKAALADPQATTQMVFIGDSITAGWNSLDAYGNGTINRDASWPYKLRRELTSRYNLPAGGTGLVRNFELRASAAGSAYYYDKRWSPAPNGIGVKANGHYVTVSNASVTFNSGASGFTPTPGDSVAITYLDTSAFTVSVDGGAKVKIPGTNTGQVRRWVKTGLTHKTHTIKVAAGFGAKARIVGGEVYTKGIQASNVAQGGSQVTGGAQDDWSVDGPLTMGSVFASPNAFGSTPTTVFIEVGANDLKSSTYETISTNVGKVASRYPNSDIVIIGYAQPGTALTTKDVKPLNALMLQMSLERGWAFWDFQEWSGGYNTLAAAGLVGDKYGHLNTQGYALMGATMANIIQNAA